MNDKTLVERLRDQYNDGCVYTTQCNLARAVGIKCCMEMQAYGCLVCLNAITKAIIDSIDREYLPRPKTEVLDADGVPIRKGDTVYPTKQNGAIRPFEVKGFNDGYVLVAYRDRNSDEEQGDWNSYLGEQLIHNKPVLDADGVPIRVGDRVWAVGQHVVKGPLNVTAVELGVVSYETEDGRHGMYFTIGDITHKEPDSLERIEADVRELPCDYFAEQDGHVCDGCRGVNYPNCWVDMVLDLLRRQREVLERGHER